LSAGGYVFVVLAGLVILGAAASQLLAYRRGQSLLSRAQLVLRLGTALMLLAVLGLSIYGGYRQPAALDAAMPPAERLHELQAATLFWTAVILLLLAAVVMALFDLRYVRASQHRARANMYRNLARLQEVLRTQAEAHKSAAEEPDGEPPSGPQGS